MGCVSRALLPHSTMQSVSSTSRYELVPPPAPKTVARPTTLGACHVRLQLSTLLLPNATLASFPAMKLTSFVALEQLKMPSESGPFVFRFRRNPSAARSSASSQLASRRVPFSRTSGRVSRAYDPSPVLLRGMRHLHVMTEHRRMGPCSAIPLHH